MQGPALPSRSLGVRTMRSSNHGKWYWRPDFFGWTVACCAVWGVIWILVGTLASTNTVHKMGYIFLGWAIGMFMASIARVVYPAPKRTLFTMDRPEQASKS